MKRRRPPKLWDPAPLVAGFLSFLPSITMAQPAPEEDVDLTAPPEGSEEDVDLTAPPEPEPAPVPDPALLAEIEALKARLDAIERPPAPEPEPEPEPPAPRWYEVLDLRVSGYLQMQAEHSQLSQDEISPDGRPLNADRFVVRRGRIRVLRNFRYASAEIEIDANNVRGPFLSLRRAEASALLPNESRPDLPPYVMLTAGLSEIPFGYELLQGNAARVFLERSTGSLAFFRGEPDTGLRLSGGLGPVRYAAAILNGVPVDDRPGAVTEVYNRKKTLVGRLGFDGTLAERLQLSGGASWLSGQGLHLGSTTTKSQLLWRDLNQDGLVTLNELSANLGQAGTPSVPFDRWAVALDAEVGLRTKLGWTRLHGEATMASNLDRGYLYADPISTGYDLRETNLVASIVQEVTPYGLLGFRMDRYDPDADLNEQRRGEFIPLDASVTTLSPLVGLQFRPLARLVFQYDYVSDHLGRDDRGVAIDLPNDTWITRLQVEF